MESPAATGPPRRGSDSFILGAIISVDGGYVAA